MLQHVPSTVRTAEDLRGLRAAGFAAARALISGLKTCSAGVTTEAIAAAVAGRIAELHAEPLFSGYRQGQAPPFPSVCCVSVNEEAVHGVPGPRTLRPGDLVGIDVGLRLDGWCSDVAASLVIPGPEHESPRGLEDSWHPSETNTQAAERLVRMTRAVLARCIALMRPGVAWSQIATEAERLTERAGMGLVTEYVGHGVGRELHEPPNAPAFWTGFTGGDFVLSEGMVIAVEPILTLDGPGSWLKGKDPGPRCRSRVRVQPDGWTIRTASGALACHEERTVLVTSSGAEILTA